VNAFAWAATVLLVGYVPLLVVALRRRPIDGLLALEMGGILLVLILLCLSEAFHRSFEYAVAIMAAVMTFVGGMVFARFIGRWM
jgi:multisubunit Na+/H+ antiporter MnhF subunit